MGAVVVVRVRMITANTIARFFLSGCVQGARAELWLCFTVTADDGQECGGTPCLCCFSHGLRVPQ